MIPLFVVLGFVLVFALFRGIARPPETAQETTTGAEMEATVDAPPDTPNPMCTSHVGCEEKDLCTRGRCEPITSRTTECRSAMVRFARTTAELSSVAQMTVERAARCIKAGRSPTIVFEESRDAFASRQANSERTEARRQRIRDALEQRSVPREYLDEIDAR